MSKWGNSYFKKLFFLYTSKLGNLEAGFGLLTDQRSAFFGWGGRSVPFFRRPLYKDKSFSNETRKLIADNGLTYYNEEMIEKKQGDLFIANAFAAHEQYLNSSDGGEEFWYFSQIMRQFYYTFKGWGKLEYHKTWGRWIVSAPKDYQTAKYSEYGKGPWDPTIVNIMTQILSKTDFDNGTGLLFDMLKALQQPLERLLPWVEREGYVTNHKKIATTDSDGNTVLEPDNEYFIRNFFPTYDLDSGGLEFSGKYLRGPSGNHKGTVNQIKEIQKVGSSFMPQQLDSKAWDLVKNHWAFFLHRYSDEILTVDNAGWGSKKTNFVKATEAWLGISAKIDSNEATEMANWFKNTLEHILEADAYDKLSVINESLRSEGRWKKEIFKKAKKILKEGMYIGSDKKLLDKVNFGDNGDVGSYWKVFDLNYERRATSMFLRQVELGDAAGEDIYVLTCLTSEGWWGYNQPPGESNPKEQMQISYRKNDEVIARSIHNWAENFDVDKLKKVFEDGLKRKTYFGERPWAGITKSGQGMSNLEPEIYTPAIPKYDEPPNPAADSIWYNLQQDSKGFSYAPRTITLSVSATANYTNHRHLTFFKINPDQYGIKNYEAGAKLVDYYDKRMVSPSFYKAPLYSGLYSKHHVYKYIMTSLGDKFYDENGKPISTELLSIVYRQFEFAWNENLKKDPKKRLWKTQEDCFNMATSYAAYSYALTILNCIKDEFIIKMFDTFVDALIDNSSLSDSDIEDLEDDFISQLKDDIEGSGASTAVATSEDLTDEEVEARQAFYKQCLLLMNMDVLSKEYQKDIYERTRETFDQNKINIHAVRNEFGGRIRMVDLHASEPDKTAIINKLISPKGQDINAFFNIRPELVSSLVPQIRLFKVFTENGQLKEIEFDFPKSMNPDTNQFTAGYTGNPDRWDFGIKEFKFSFDGTNPATARNDIVADLTLFFRDFNDLTKKRKLNEFSRNKTENNGNLSNFLDNDSNMYSYIDLLLFPGSIHKNNSAPSNPFNYDPSNYRIRADVGWVTRKDAAFDKLATQCGTSQHEIQKALEKINKSFYLNMTDHDLDFANDGSIIIKVKYRAYIESVSKTTSMDVLATPEINTVRKTIQEELSRAWEVCNAEQMYDLTSTYRTIESELLKKSYQSIVSRLLRRRRMFYVFADAESREQFSSTGFFEKRPKLYNGKMAEYDVNSNTNRTTAEQPEQVEMEQATGDVKKQKADTFYLLDGDLEEFVPESVSISNSEDSLEIVNFFYVGDLLHTLMDCMYEPPENNSSITSNKMKEDVKNTVLLLASFNYKHPLDAKTSRSLNIAEIPVALDYFIEFMTKNVIEGERRSYPIMHFMRDFCNRLIVDIMNDLCVNTTETVNKLRFQTTTLLATEKEITPFDPLHFAVRMPGETRIIDLTAAYNFGDNVPFNSSLEGRSIDNAYNYIAIYPVASNMVTTDPQNAPSGVKSEDERNGINHLYIGRPRGLVKTISFAKTDMQYLREARYFNHGYNGLMQLGGVYKATIEMIGNTLFYPGMTVFIDPTSLASSGMDPTIGTGNGSGPSIANALGIGGYHLITKVNSIIGPGKFNTTVEAQFYYSGDKQALMLKSVKDQQNQPEKDQREKFIEDNQGMAGGTDTNFCANIISIRQQQASDVLNGIYNQVLGDSESASSLQNSIHELESKRAENAIKQKNLDLETAASNIIKSREKQE